MSHYDEQREAEIDNATVSINISKKLLSKLEWALASGNDKQRVEFIIEKAIELSEKTEGFKYPPRNYKSFQHVEVKT